MKNNQSKSSKRLYKEILENYYSEGSIKKSKEDKFFERWTKAFLDLRECEQIYMNDDSLPPSDLTYYLSDDNISLSLKVNNELIISSEDPDEDGIEEPDNDVSGLSLSPIHSRYDDKYDNYIVGIRFKIASQMGYNIEYISKDLDDLKKIKTEIDNYIERIENRSTLIKVKGYGLDYEFVTQSAFGQFPYGDDERSEYLRVDHGFSKYFQVVNVIRTNYGEDWYVEGNEINKNDYNFKISIVSYPCTFSFYVQNKFKTFNSESKNDDGRSNVLLAKMKEFNIPSPAHAYEDYIIEEVRVVKGGEEWILGS
jgi:hypothetical protein